MDPITPNKPNIPINHSNLEAHSRRSPHPQEETSTRSGSAKHHEDKELQQIQQELSSYGSGHETTKKKKKTKTKTKSMSESPKSIKRRLKEETEAEKEGGTEPMTHEYTPIVSPYPSSPRKKKKKKEAPTGSKKMAKEERSPKSSKRISKEERDSEEDGKELMMPHVDDTVNSPSSSKKKKKKKAKTPKTKTTTKADLAIPSLQDSKRLEEENDNERPQIMTDNDDTRPSKTQDSPSKKKKMSKGTKKNSVAAQVPPPPREGLQFTTDNHDVAYDGPGSSKRQDSPSKKGKLSKGAKKISKTSQVSTPQPYPDSKEVKEENGDKGPQSMTDKAHDMESIVSPSKKEKRTKKVSLEKPVPAPPSSETLSKKKKRKQRKGRGTSPLRTGQYYGGTNYEEGRFSHSSTTDQPGAFYVGDSIQRSEEGAQQQEEEEEEEATVSIQELATDDRQEAVQTSLIEAEIAPDIEEVAKEIVQEALRQRDYNIARASVVDSNGDQKEEGGICTILQRFWFVIIICSTAAIATAVSLAIRPEEVVKDRLSPTSTPTSIPLPPTAPPTVMPTSLAPTQAPTEEFSPEFEELYVTIGALINPANQSSLRDISTKQHWALRWLSDVDILDNLASLPTQAIIERFVMVLFYNSTGGTNNNWIDDLNFLTLLPTCGWGADVDGNLQGVVCSELDITGLTFSGISLTGSLPTEIGLLTSLKFLYLNSNSIVGTIPTEIANLQSLEILHLAFNSMTGTIPTEIGLLSNLWAVDFGRNFFVGEIPKEIGSLSNSLGSLVFDENNLSGPIPTALGQLTKLQYLWMSFNPLVTGPIPSELGLLTELIGLSFVANNLVGTVPDELGDLTRLNVLFMNANVGITGTLPTSFQQLTDLIYFRADSTAMTGGIEETICDVVSTMQSVPFEQLFADCGGSDPEVECSCCTHCCSLSDGCVENV